jgi:hypothetical protein
MGKLGCYELDLGTMSYSTFIMIYIHYVVNIDHFIVCSLY